MVEVFNVINNRELGTGGDECPRYISIKDSIRMTMGPQLPTGHGTRTSSSYGLAAVNDSSHSHEI
jgi:hypothetical protein